MVFFTAWGTQYRFYLYGVVSPVCVPVFFFGFLLRTVGSTSGHCSSCQGITIHKKQVPLCVCQIECWVIVNFLANNEDYNMQEFLRMHFVWLLPFMQSCLPLWRCIQQGLPGIKSQSLEVADDLGDVFITWYSSLSYGITHIPSQPNRTRRKQGMKSRMTIEGLSSQSC